MSEGLEYPYVRLRCSGSRDPKGERHIFYVRGTDRLGRMGGGTPMQARCPECGEAVAGGVVVVAKGKILRGGRIVEDPLEVEEVADA